MAGHAPVSMSGLLLSLWIALLGADRIDLAGGDGPFVITPFLVLTPVVIAAELVRRGRRGRAITVPRPALVYITAAVALVAVVFLSVFRAINLPVSAARASLLVIDVGGTFAVALLCADRTDLAKVFARGAIASLGLFALFDVAESLWWIGQGPELLRIGTVTAHFDSLQNAGVLPRPAGPVHDANRGGFVLLFYLFTIAAARFGKVTTSLSIGLCTLLLLATMSRSAALGAFAALGVALASRQRGISLRGAAAAALATVAAATFVFANPSSLDRLDIVTSSAAVKRFSTTEGSAQGHVTLIERGIDEGLESLPRALFGLGFGNAYIVLRDIFPDSRYGNFHSLYLTMFAEAGIGALLLTLILTAAPVVTGGPWRPLVAGAIAFNIFYQTATEPAFWLLLALAWFTMPTPDSMRVPVPLRRAAE